jgi:ABC-type sugar transport system substrate-binding protein
MRTRPAILSGAVLASLVLLATLLTAASASASPSGSAAKAAGPVWTAADVAKVARANGVAPFVPVYAVPKKLSKRYKLGFINPDLSNPFFATWSKAMKAAAKFYGVSFVQGNAATKYDRETDIYDTLAAQNIDAVGAHPGNTVIAQKAKKAKMPFTTIDSVVKGAASLGVPDVQAGTLAAQLLTPEIKKRLAGTWKGKNVFFVGLGVPGCTPCEVRPHTAFDVLSKSIKLEGSAFTSEYATPEVGQKFMTEIMTAHPNSVFAIVPLNDESLIGVIPALKAADKLDDAVAITLGGDPAGRKLLRENPNTVIAAIDFNPFAEAWNWVAASIAQLQGKKFKPYRLSTTLTPQNVNKLYPNDARTN